MAATEEMGSVADERRDSLKQSLLLAMLSLPCADIALADLAPERAQLSYKYLDYQDSQPGWDRIGVNAHAMSLLVPITEEWSVEGSITSDTVSGASPAYHSQEMLAGHMEEKRTGRDLKVTRYFSRGTLTVGAADSRESDYMSDSLFFSGTLSSEDKNTTLAFGMGHTSDDIDVPDFGINHESKKINDTMLGITQVMGPSDIVQLNVTHAAGHGFFSDPYKYRDNRPDSKYQSTAQGRWNHHFSATGGTSRLSYRYYTDSFGVDAHTLAGEYVQPVDGGWTFTPGIRLHAQSAADFYLDPVNPPFPTIRPNSEYQSQDQRLSAFGGLSVSLKVSKQITEDFLVDVRYERYEQRSDWYPFGEGSPDIEPFRANIIQVGATQFF